MARVLKSLCGELTGSECFLTSSPRRAACKKGFEGNLGLTLWLKADVFLAEGYWKSWVLISITRRRRRKMKRFP